MSIDLFREGEPPSMSNFNRRIEQANASMSKKVSNDPNARIQIPNGSDLQTFLVNKPFGDYYVFGEDFVSNMPTADIDWWFIRLSQLGIEAFRACEPSKLWRISFLNGVIAGWSLIATATPPQELVLPLEVGFTKVSRHKCCYSKAQNGTVLVHVAIQHTSGLLPVGNYLCATLPHGYRPAEIIGDSKGFGAVAVGVYGDIRYEIKTAVSELIFTLEFLSSTGP